MTRDRGVPPIAVLAVAVLCLAPLALTPVLPFIDFYAHVTRYFILSQVAEAPLLELNYEPAWNLLPNLGLDVFATGLMKLLPPLTAAHVVAVLMILIPFFGILALARVLHGRIPWSSVLLAGILVHSHILIWGFANFLVGIGIAFFGLAGWIALAPRPALQLALGVPFAVLLMIVHGLSFAIWGLMLGMIELFRARDAGEWCLGALPKLVIRMLRLACLAILPALLFTQMPTAAAEDGVTAAFSNLAAHAAEKNLVAEILDELGQRLDYSLRVADSGWPWIDRILGALLWGALILGLLVGALRLDARLWGATALAVMLVGLMPPNLFGVGYMDDRMPLLVLMLLAAGLSATNGRGGRVMLAGFAALFALRLILVGVGYHQDSQHYTAYLDAVEGLQGGQLGAAANFDGTGARSAPRPNCKPLLFMLLLKKGVPVDTFANPTQQPLVIKGALQRAQSEPPVTLPPENTFAERQTVMADLLHRGYDIVVTCDISEPGARYPGFSVVASRAPWTLYRISTGTPDVVPRD